MKQVAIYSVLLTVAMVGAYMSWTSEVSADSEAAAEEVAVYSARSGDVKKLMYDGDKLDVVVERRSDDRGDYVWVSVEETREKAVPPPAPEPEDEAPEEGEDGEDGEGGDETSPDDAPEGPEVAPEPDPEPEVEVEVEVERKEFLGNESSVGLFDSFEPLMALRELRGDAIDLEAFGLVEPEAKIVVTRSAGDTTIELGSETYGSRDKYARHDGRLMLLEDTTVRPLQFAATRLVERRLHPLLEQDLDRVEIQRGANSLALIQRNKDDRQAAFWARADDEDSKDDTADTWLDKLLRLKAAGYPTDIDLTGATEAFSVSLTAGSETWRFTVLQDAAGDKVYARSEFNRGVVELTASLANEAIADADDLFVE